MATTQTTPQQPAPPPRRRGRPRRRHSPELWAFSPQPVTIERLHYLFMDFLDNSGEVAQTAMAYMLGLWVETDAGFYDAMKATIAMELLLEDRDGLVKNMERPLLATYRKAQVTRKLLGMEPLPDLGLQQDK